MTAATLRPHPAPRLAGIPRPALSTGLTVTLLYVFGPVPLYLATASTFANSEQVTSGFFLAWLTSGVATIVFSVRYRQPFAIGFSGAGLVYMASVSAGHSPGEFAGATLFAGAGMLVLSVTGLAERLTRVLPVPVVLAVFAGSSLHICTAGVSGVEAEPLAGGALVAGYFAARRLGNPRFPPLAVGAALGLAALTAQGRFHAANLEAGAPRLDFVMPVFDPGAMVGVGIPLLLLAVGLQNMQGFGGARLRGFEPPVSAGTGAMGALSMLNGLFGAPPSAMQTTPLFLMAAEEAGPRESRWIGAVVASVSCIAIAASAVTVASFVGSVPPAFLAVTVGLILLTTVFEGLKTALAGPLAFPAFVAFIVAASDLAIFGMGAPLWAMLLGAAVTTQAVLPARPNALASLPRERARAA